MFTQLQIMTESLTSKWHAFAKNPAVIAFLTACKS